MLYIVATPIGNLKDITLRAIETLQSVDGIICEDTRRTGLLLNHLQIQKPMTSFNDFNENRTFPEIIQRLKMGQNLALVSDAGTPLVSDPGFKLVRECIKEGLEIDSLPGPSAVITALTLSGIAPDKFFFLGYLPEKPGRRESLLKSLKELPENLETTFIIFLSPHKLIKTLEEIKNYLGDIEISLTGELTKMYQKILRGKVSEVLTKHKNPKGEYVLIFRLTNPS